MTSRDEPLVIGIGNDFRGDDGVGLAVVRQLRALALAGVTCVEIPGDAVALLAAWRDRSYVVLVDAMVSGAHPGTVRRFDLRAQGVSSAGTLHSTHAMGIADAVRLADALGELPPHLVVFAVEALDVGYGERFTPPVERAIAPLVQRIAMELAVPLASDTGGRGRSSP